MNEIPVVQNVLRTLDLKLTIVIFNALHTQKETVADVTGQKVNYVGGLKGNQSDLLEATSSVFTKIR